MLIVALIDGGDPVHLCGICGFVLGGPCELCPRCALINEDVAVALDGRRVAESVQEWFREKGEPPNPHPLEAELEKIQTVFDALEECPPLWWADKMLWRGLRWFYRMRKRRVGEAWDQFTEKTETATVEGNHP